MQHRALFVALALCAGRALAGCSKDADGVRHCTGLSWTARLWIYVGAAVIFVLCNIFVVYLIRRHYRKKKARLPAAPGAVPYAPGEYWNRRLEYLPGFKPPETLLPVVAAVPESPSQMTQSSSRPWVSRSLPPVARASTRTSEQPPAYETTLGPRVVELPRSDSESTLAEASVAASAPPMLPIARAGPPVPPYENAGRRTQEPVV